MVLDGIQYAIYKELHGKLKDIDYTDGDTTRFADDILVTARTEESANKILDTLNSFLAVRGLSVSPTKTRIIRLSEGFDFLSRNYQYKDGYVYATPSKAAVAKMEKSVIEFIDDYSGSQKVLIDKLNKKLVGWANYHRITEATAEFRHIDNVVRASLLAMCERLYPRTKRKKIFERFFFKEPDGEHVYIMENKPDVRVQRIAKTVLVKHHPVHVGKNPYIDCEYFENRSKHKEIAAVTGDYKKIWRRQDGKCFYCGGAILADDRRDVVIINPTLRENFQNLAYIHERCRECQAEFYRAESEITSDFDLLALLNNIREHDDNANKKPFRYQPLLEHFKSCNKAVLIMTFAEIEEIIGRELCNTAYIHAGYWHSLNGSRICSCWTSAGYKIRKLYLNKERIVFERCADMGTSSQIPAFMYKSMPPNAKAEVDIFFKYVKGKYGL
jgi:RNA-directed DNA polymerase